MAIGKWQVAKPNLLRIAPRVPAICWPTGHGFESRHDVAWRPSGFSQEIDFTIAPGMYMKTKANFRPMSIAPGISMKTPGICENLTRCGYIYEKAGGYRETSAPMDKVSC